jgi:hypothetical protein
MVLARTPNTNEVATRAMKQAQKSFMFAVSESAGEELWLMVETVVRKKPD